MSESIDACNVTKFPGFSAVAPGTPVNGEPHIFDEVSRLLADADPMQEPILSPILPESQWLVAPRTQVVPPGIEAGPDPGHRNAIICPQCDRWAWRATQECWNCRYDLFAHAEREALERHRQWIVWQRQRLSYWALGLFAGGLGAIVMSSKVASEAGSFMTIAGVFALVLSWGCVKRIERLKY